VGVRVGVGWDGVGVGWGQVARRMELEMSTGFWMGNLKITLVVSNTVPDYRLTLK
jgi:hypothetical protein